MTFFLPKKMKYFMVTMELRNFSKAAENLCITRSPLSKVISEMEGYFGGELFRRTYNELEPTILAWDIYSKIKPLYNNLLDFEMEFNNSGVNKSINITFDISFPEVLYKHMLMTMSAHDIRAECKRTVIDYNGINNASSCNTDMIISLRAIPELYGTNLEKWEGGDYVLILHDLWEPQNKGKLYIWKDSYTEYIKERVMDKFSEEVNGYEFIGHNHDLITLLYNVRLGRGGVIMPKKIACLHKMNNTVVKSLNGKSSMIYLYRKSPLKNKKEANIIKMLLNDII